jgi:thiosulfate dehydrogenase
MSRAVEILGAHARLEGFRMKSFVLGIIITLIALPILGILFIRSSYMSVAATDPPLPLETTLAKMGLHARIASQAPQRDVSKMSTADLVSGAQVYQKNCAFCHGLPNQPASAAGKGMFPHAPQLFTQQETVSDDPAGVTYWKVKNGIRLTGMPSFGSALSDEQMWQVTGLLAHSDNLPPEVQDALKSPPLPLASASPGPSAVPAAKSK